LVMGWGGGGGGGGRAGGNDLNMKPVGRIKETVGT